MNFAAESVFLAICLVLFVLTLHDIRFEGNTEGKAAVFGLFHTAGLKLPATPGNLLLRFAQRFGHFTGSGGRSFSKEEDIPAWWVSKSRGADDTDPQ